MFNYRTTALFSAWILFVGAAMADTLTFVAQPVSGGGIDYNWFNPANWFTTDSTGNLIPAGRVPLENETAILTGLVDLNAGGVRVVTLVQTNNAIVTNGTVAVENLLMLSGSRTVGTTVNVLTAVTVGGTNCILDAATLNILSIASGSLQPVFPATASTLILTNGALVQNGGLLSLTDGSSITGGGLPQSKLVLQQGTVLSSTNSAVVRGAASGHLIIDNSGLIRVDGGVLTFMGGIDWQCSVGSEEFRAVAPTGLILFSNSFYVDSPVTSLFTGLGTNRWLAGATVDGSVQISSLDPATQLAGPGNLEMFNSVIGAGALHILGTTNQGGAGTWVNGTLGVAALTIDPGANLVMSGGLGTTRQIAGCIVSNLGSCTLWSGDLTLGQGAVFNNQSGATFVVQGDGTFTGSGVFNNAGIFQKLSPGTLQFGATNSTPGPNFNNSGLLDLRSGQLDLLGGISSGEFRQATGAVLWFWGGAHILITGANFTGNGAVRLSQGTSPASWLVDAAISVSQLEIGANGTLDASAAPQGKSISIATLQAHDNAVLSNGTFQVQRCQLQDQSSADLSTMNISAALTVSGTNCTLNATTLSLPSRASATLQPIAPGVAGAALTLAQGSVLQTGGQLSLTDGSVILGAGLPQSKLVIQTGGILTLTNSGSIQGSTNAHLVLDNSGVIRVDGGTLTLGDNLDFQTGAGVGEFNASVPSALLLFSGPVHVGNGTTILFTGSGTNIWLQGGRVDGTAQVGAMDASSQLPKPGNVEIANSASGAGFVHVTGGSSGAGNVWWNNGVLSLAHVDVDSGGTLLIGGSTGTNRQLSGCALNNSGACTFPGGDLVLAQGALINNKSGGSFLLQRDLALKPAPGAGTVTINNAGSFVSKGAVASTVGADFNNSGSLEIQSGTLNFQGSWTQTQGTTTIDAGGALGGTNLTLLGGVVTGTGTIGAKLLNAGGTVLPGAPLGVLSTAIGDDYQQNASGSLAVELGGTVPGSQFTQFAVGGNASLDGQLQLQLTNGFVPQPGQTFRILTCNALSGRFASIAAPPSAGAVWVPRYNGTNVTLVLASNVSLGSPSISGGSLTLSVNTTPGILYTVQASNSLSPPDWQTISTFSGDGTVKVVSDPAAQTLRFYRVILQ